MAGPLIFDFVADTTTTTGTGDLTLANSTPTDGTVLPNDVLANNDTFIYSVKHRTAREWETGVGTFNTTGPKLVRTTVRRSSNAAAAVNFSAGTKDVRIAPVRDWASDWLVRTAADASLALAQSGQVGFPNNGFYLRRHNGTLAQPWGPIFPFTEPVNADFAWTNQGSASVSTTNGGIYLSGPSNSNSYNLRIRKKSAPSTPYTITAAFTFCWDCLGTAGYGPRFGLLWRQSSNGNLVVLTISPTSHPSAQNSSTTDLLIEKWNTENSYSANYDSVYNYVPVYPVVWFRIGDDGTNRTCHISADGQNFIQVHSVGRTDFMTPDEVGFFISPYDMTAGMTLLSWKEA